MLLSDFYMRSIYFIWHQCIESFDYPADVHDQTAYFNHATIGHNNFEKVLNFCAHRARPQIQAFAKN